MFRLRMLAVLVIGATAIFVAPVGHAAQLAQGIQGEQKPPPALPQSAIDAITAASCDPIKLEAAVKQAVTANKDLAGDIAGLAVGQCPGDAAGVAGTAASASPTQVAAVLVSVIEALPPGQQENAAPAIILALEDAVPEATDQITTAITQLAFSAGPNPGTGGRSNTGAPLVAAHTDVPSSPVTGP